MNITIKNKFNETLDYTFDKGLSDSVNLNWIAVLGHGVTGNKDRPIIKDTADALNDIGMNTLRFSFSGNGGSEGEFRESTISKEVDDLKAVIDAVSTKYENIIYVGHSMGAAVGALQATNDDRINAIISLAGMVDTKTFARTEFGEETPDEGLMWEEEACPLSSAFMIDLCAKIKTVEPLVFLVKAPWLLIHGSEDDVINPNDSKKVKAIRGKSATLEIIEGADHSFNDPAHKTKAIDAIKKWLSE